MTLVVEIEEDKSEDNLLQSKFSSVCEYIKLFLASGVVFTLVLVAFIGISHRWCILQVHPAVLFLLLFGALTLLAYLEALHYACVSVEKWDMSNYVVTFPRAYKCYLLVDTPEKVKKFLVGRQFFTIFVVFLIAQITSFPGIPHNFAGMPRLLVTILIQTGLPGIAIVLTFGQLISQIYVEEFTLPFLNLFGCEFVIRLSLFTEWIGVCNFSWLLFHISSFVCCKSLCGARNHNSNTETNNNNNSVESNNAENGGIVNNEGNMSPTEKNRDPNYTHVSAFDHPLTPFDYFKYAWSTCATLFSVVIIIYGISIGSYVFPVPVVGAFIVYFCVLTILFYLEGMMIAIVSTQYWDKETFRTTYTRAYKLHDIINKPDNVKRFIIGRQFCTVLTNFLLAQITTFVNFPSEGYNPILFYIVVQSGLVGVLTTLSFGQLMPELLAQEYPLRFMNMFGSYSIGFISLVFDAIGVGHCAWAIYFLTKKLCCGSLISSSREGISVKMNSGDTLAKDLKFSQKTSFDIEGENEINFNSNGTNNSL